MRMIGVWGLLILFLAGGLVFAQTGTKQPAASPLEEELQKLREAGIPTTIEELNLPEIPDEENAALVYQKVFDLMDKNKEDIQDKFRDLPSYSDITQWTEEQKKEISLFIKKNKEIYELLEKATSMPKCRFPIKYEDGPEMLLMHLAKLRMCARFLAVKSIMETEKGQMENALDIYISGIKLTQSLSNEPVLISSLVRIAIDSMMLSSLEEILNKGTVDNKSYTKLVQEIMEEKESRIISFGLQGESILSGLWIYNRISKGPIKDTLEHFRLLGFGMGPPEEPGKLIKKYLPFAENDIVFYLQTISSYISLSKEPYWQAKDKLEQLEKNLVTLPREKYLLSFLLLPALSPSYLKEARSDAYSGAAVIAIANRIYRQKHGEFAESLSQLTPDILPTLPLDPFTGKDYIYRKKDKGFIVYSVADNMKDDGGFSQNEKGWQGDYDIVWEDKN